MLSTILEHITSHQLKDLKGSVLNCKIPFSIPVLNRLFELALEENKAFESIEIISIKRKKVTLNVTIGSVKIARRTFELIDRKVVVKIHPVLTPPNFDVEIEVLDGLGTIENEILELLFKTLFKNETFDFDSKKIFVDHSKLFDNTTYQNILKYIQNGTLETCNNKLVYNLEMKF